MDTTTYQLSDLVTIKYGKNQKKVADENGNIPIYGTGGLMGFATQALYDKPSVLIGRKGSIDKVKYVDHPFWTVDTLFYTIVNEDIVIPKYLYYLMSLMDMKQYNEGTTIPSLRTETLNRIELEIPPVVDQKKVLECLNPIDAKITNNEAINRNLAEQIQLLYTTYFENEESREWKTVPLSDLIFFQEGPGIRNWQYVDKEGTKFINIRCINNGDIDVSTANMISNEEANGKYAHFMLKPYDIVMSCSGTLGRYAIVREEHLPLCLNTSVIRFSPAVTESDFSYVYGYMTSKEFLNRQKEMACGSVQANFGPTHLNKMEIHEPPLELRKEYHSTVFPIIQQMICLRRENDNLAKTRDSLLPKLISGELDVSELDL